MAGGVLDEAQQRAVDTDAATVCVLAGAGSGKTRVLTRRVARRIVDGSADANHTLVLTFTRKAAGELRLRLRGGPAADHAADITTGTFHAIAYAQLRQRWLDQGRHAPNVVAQPTRLLAEAVAATGTKGRVDHRSLAAEISWAKSHCLTPDLYGAGARTHHRRASLPPSQVAFLWGAYEQEKRRRRTVDFDDLLALVTEALNTDRNFAAAQRWRFRHVFVDEFQDLDRAQFALLQAWLGERDDLFVVGDPNQAIYGWNGADAGYLTEIERHFPAVEVINLTANYRSTPAVLHAASVVLPAAPTKIGLPDEQGVGESGPPPVVRSFVDERAEAVGVARAVRHAHQNGRQWADLAVLVRTNAQRVHIEQALTELGVPHRSGVGAAWLHRPEVREAMSYLRELPRLGLAARAPDLEAMAAELPEEQRSSLYELIATARLDLQADPTVTVADFLAGIEVASTRDGPVGTETGVGAVAVSTFHRAKGLEWPVVFLAGVEVGLVPFGRGEAEAEEQRLFYVAITRAREELHLSWAQERTVGTRQVDRQPSPWLLAIERGAADASTATSGKGLRSGTALTAAQHVAEIRSALGEPVGPHVESTGADEVASADVEARAALERWRTSRARMSGVEPRLILRDEVLDAIVDLRPVNLEELAATGFGLVRAASVGGEVLTAIGTAHEIDEQPEIT